MEKIIAAMRLLIEAINDDKINVVDGMYTKEYGYVFFTPNRERTTLEERRVLCKAICDIGAIFVEGKRARFSSQIWTYLVRNIGGSKRAQLPPKNANSKF